ncbi:MAG: selenium metabolism-associated LysR family transcriptional regulator [Tissierellia bacterium]|nr:selenium metabolism-associated LysR family transcriptional regulator [Tissierellia bacterium]MDD4781228.1 selenium metabolism-associated LysR family transcriptional regulator [Tissierellia bacterium]
MNTSYLKTFIEVINMRNISKAAEKLFVTQPAVSKQLQILEKDFEATLFKKNGREIIPTEEGILLYKYAIKLLNEENKIYSLIKNDDNLSGELLIYTSTLPANYYIHDLIIDFANIYPDITYKIIKADSKAVYDYIEDGQTSYGFTGSIYKNKRINNICIAEDEVILVASKNIYDEFSNKKITIDMLRNQNFIIREKGSATLQTFEDFIIKKNINISDLKIKIQAEDNEIIKNFAINNMGIGVISKIAAEKEINEGLLFKLDVDGLEIKRHLYYVYHKDRYYSKIEEKFKEFIINKFDTKN